MSQPPINQPPQQPIHHTTVIYQQPPKKSKVWLFALLGLSCLCLVPFAANLDKSKAAKDSNVVESAETSGAQKVDPVKVTAEQLFQDFKANTVAAEEKYKEKPLLVSGTVADIGKDMLDDPYVTFKVGGKYEISNVQAFFTDEEESKLGSLRKGQKLTIRAEFKGEIVKSVILHHSVIQ